MSISICAIVSISTFVSLSSLPFVSTDTTRDSAGSGTENNPESTMNTYRGDTGGPSGRGQPYGEIDTIIVL